MKAKKVKIYIVSPINGKAVISDTLNVLPEHVDFFIVSMDNEIDRFTDLKAAKACCRRYNS